MDPMEGVQHEHDPLFSEESENDENINDENVNNENVDTARKPTKKSQLPAAVRAALDTPWDQVFQLSEDGTTYIRPNFLRGVPVSGLPESYHEHGWASLNDYLAKEDAEEKLKAKYIERSKRDPGSKALRDRAKLHKDNVSKHRKIAEVFGGTSTRHPNQVIAKGHLPAAGLCEQEVMYMLGCKYTDLARLSLAGELAMDPWDFLRWRIGMLLISKLQIYGQSGRANIRGVIHSISSEKSDDPVFRAIIEYSAARSGRLARYGKKGNRKSTAVTGGNHGSGSNGGGHKDGGSSKKWLYKNSAAFPRAPPTVSREEKEAEIQRFRAERKALLREKEERRKQAGTSYTGVNGYRRQQQQQEEQPQRPMPRGGPCGG